MSSETEACGTNEQGVGLNYDSKVAGSIPGLGVACVSTRNKLLAFLCH